MTVLKSLSLYLVRVVKGNNAQGPEAAEHGEDGQTQVVSRGQHDEVVLALAVAGAVALEEYSATTVINACKREKGRKGQHSYIKIKI